MAQGVADRANSGENKLQNTIHITGSNILIKTLQFMTDLKGCLDYFILKFLFKKEAIYVKSWWNSWNLSNIKGKI